MIKKIVSTTDAPQAIGPYSQAVQVGHLLFCSGQIPLDPKSGQISAHDIEGQTIRVIENIRALLKSVNSDLASVVKTTIFLKSMADFPKVNEIYGNYFKPPYPARSTVEVSRLPKEVFIEIEVIADLS